MLQLNQNLEKVLFIILIIVFLLDIAFNLGKLSDRNYQKFEQQKDCTLEVIQAQKELNQSWLYMIDKYKEVYRQEMDKIGEEKSHGIIYLDPEWIEEQKNNKQDSDSLNLGVYWKSNSYADK